MHKLTLLAILGLIAAAETPKVPPAAAPKVAVLNETDQLRVENIQLRLQLAKTAENDLQVALNGIFTKACQSIGGATFSDCNAMGPTPVQPGYHVTLKPVAAKAEVLKK